MNDYGLRKVDLARSLLRYKRSLSTPLVLI